MTGSRPTRTTTNARQRTEPDDQLPSAVSKSSTVGRSDSAISDVSPAAVVARSPDGP